MKIIQTSRFQILIATHSGMCFGVRQAIEATESLLSSRSATILGELAHNPVVQSRMAHLGAHSGHLQNHRAQTLDVVITAHGASDQDRERWKRQGYRILDTTCPLVRVAHQKLANLVAKGFFPVIIGKEDHVEVRGLRGDFSQAQVILQEEDFSKIPQVEKIGLISQTTQPIERVIDLVKALRNQRPEADVTFCDTVCQPTKDRQRSLDDLCRAADVVIAVGGKSSNNTAALARTARAHGCQAYHIEGPSDLRDRWLAGARKVGLTAGTSTLEVSVQAVTKRLQELGS